MKIKKIFRNYEPPELAYRGYLEQPMKKLKCGWKAFFIVNSVVVLRSENGQELNFGQVKKLVEANDGKFMIVKKDKSKAVFNQKGELLADFSKQAFLFDNGWFILPKDDELSLFDENEELIAEKVTKAKVFKDGKYFISVKSGGNANKVGFFDADGSRIIFTNDRSFKRLFPYFFIADGSLYDLTGECLIDANSGSNFNRMLVRFIGSLHFLEN